MNALLIAILAMASVSQSNWPEVDDQLRLAGRLEEAREHVQKELGRADLDAREEIALRLELAKIYDRVGLHTNTRPVQRALEEIEQATVLAEGQDAGARGAVESSRATYYYRAEMSERGFPNASEHATQAIDLLKQAGMTRLQSDATHQLGLIFMQKREYELARTYFDESLELDKQAGQRKWMLGEYHRHVGFLEAYAGDWPAALPHFEASLRFRKECGAIDASLFAAISLGSAFINTGSPEAAEEHLQYAVDVAEAIGSAMGVARASLVLGAMYEKLAQPQEATAAYRKTLEAASQLNHQSMVDRAQLALKRLGE